MGSLEYEPLDFFHLNSTEETVEDRISSFVTFSAIVLRLDLRGRRTRTLVPAPANEFFNRDV